MSINKVILVGHLGRDPESRRAPSGDMICNLSLATTETWKDKHSGERREQTEWHRVVLFGRTAEVAAQYLRRGAQVYIEGRLQTRKWTDRDGTERYTTEVRGDVMRMLGGRQDATPQAAPAPARERRQAAPVAGGGLDELVDDIPF